MRACGAEGGRARGPTGSRRKAGAHAAHAAHTDGARPRMARSGAALLNSGLIQALQFRGALRPFLRRFPPRIAGEARLARRPDAACTLLRARGRVGATAAAPRRAEQRRPRLQCKARCGAAGRLGRSARRRRHAAGAVRRRVTPVGCLDAACAAGRGRRASPDPASAGYASPCHAAPCASVRHAQRAPPGPGRAVGVLTARFRSLRRRGGRKLGANPIGDAALRRAPPRPPFSPVSRAPRLQSLTLSLPQPWRWARSRRACRSRF